MKRSLIVVCLLLFTLAALAQGNTGSITGSVTDPDGGTVAGVPIQVKDVASGVIHKAVSSSTGTFSVTQLPAGTYEVFIPAIGFTFVPYQRKDIVIQGGQTLRSDIRLDWPINLGTVGDDTFLTIRNRYAGLSGPTPRMPDGKPDFSGVWNGTSDTNSEQPDVLPWVTAKVKEWTENNFKDLPSAFCLPGEPFPSGPVLYKIVQTPTLLVILTEDVTSHWQVFLDGRGHPADPDPTWHGHSIGKWEGDTLVIDTVGFNDKSWLPPFYPHTAMMHVVERYHRPDLAHLMIDITIEDPGTFTKPWQLHLVWDLAPGEEVLEYVCTENNQEPQHLVGK